MLNSFAAMTMEVSEALVDALDALAGHKREILMAWRKRLQKYPPCRPHIPRLSGLQIVIDRNISSLTREAVSERYMRLGEDLARTEMPAECASASLALFVESCIPHLTSEGMQMGPWVMALVRWAAGCQFFILSGYARHAAIERRAHDEKINHAERRVQDVSIRMAEAYEKERRRLAHDLHDEIGHDLIVLNLYTEMMSLDLKKGDTKQLNRKLRESTSLIKHALKGVRSITFDLGPAIWHEQGFVPAVKLYTRQYCMRTGIKIRLDASRLSSKLPPSYETALYKILRGALSNVVAHAEARNIKVTLATTKESAIMRIVDDGKGFNVERKLSNPAHSYGLRAMRDRVELLGGTIRFAPAQEGEGASRRGTTIELQLPLRESEPTS